MGLCPVSHHRLLWHSGAGAVNRSYKQQLSKDPEWCWMEAGSAFTLSFPDPGASAGSHLLCDGSCPTHSVFHRPSINLVLTFGPLPLELGTPSPLTSKPSIPVEQSSHYRSSLQLSTESACKNCSGYEHRLELQGQ